MSCSFVSLPLDDTQHFTNLPLYAHSFSSPDVNKATASSVSSRSRSVSTFSSVVVVVAVVVVVVVVVVVSLALMIPWSLSAALIAAVHSCSPTAASSKGKAASSLEKRKQDFGMYALVFQLKRPSGDSPFKAQVLIV